MQSKVRKYSVSKIIIFLLFIIMYLFYTTSYLTVYAGDTGETKVEAKNNKGKKVLVSTDNFVAGMYYTNDKDSTSIIVDIDNHKGVYYECTAVGGQGKATFEEHKPDTKSTSIKGTSFGENDQLTQIFSTAGFQGSAAALSKASFVGKFMGYLISYVCLAILCVTVFQIMMTMLYVSSPVIFDKVADLNKSFDNPFGLGNVVSGKAAVLSKPLGMFDKVLNFVFSNFLNVKELSDYSDKGVSMYDLDANKPTMMQYFSKRSLQIILIIFFASIGYNGALLRAYSTVVSGMGQALEHVIDYNLAATVEDLLNSGTDYKFGYDTDKTETGELTQAAVKQIYANVLACLKSSQRSKELKQVLGYNVDVLCAPKILDKLKDIENPKGWAVSVHKESVSTLYDCKGDGEWAEPTDHSYAIRFNVKDILDNSIDETAANNNFMEQYVYVYLYRARNDVDSNWLDYAPDKSYYLDN